MGALNLYLDAVDYIAEGDRDDIGNKLEELGYVIKGNDSYNRGTEFRRFVLLLVTDAESSDDVANGAKVHTIINGNVLRWAS